MIASISVVIWLVGTLLLDTQITSLVVIQNCQFNTEFLQVQSSNFLIQLRILEHV